MVLGFVIGAGISAVGSIIGGNKAAKAAKSQVDSQNDAAKRQYEYDLELHQMTADKIVADREEAIIAI